MVIDEYLLNTSSNKNNDTNGTILHFRTFYEATYQIKESLQVDCKQTKEVARMRAAYANKFNPFCSKGNE